MNRDLAKDKTSIHLWLLSSCLDSAQLLDPPQLQMAWRSFRFLLPRQQLFCCNLQIILEAAMSTLFKNRGPAIPALFQKCTRSAIYTFACLVSFKTAVLSSGQKNNLWFLFSVLYLFLQIHIETAKNGSCRRGFDVGVQPEGKVLLCYKKATTVLQKCCKSATTVLQRCYCATKKATTVLQRCCKSATKTLQLCYNSLLCASQTLLIVCPKNWQLGVDTMCGWTHSFNCLVDLIESLHASKLANSAYLAPKFLSQVSKGRGR